jgi:hypothetical protein
VWYKPTFSVFVPFINLLVSSEFTFTFIVTIIISVFVPGHRAPVFDV